MNIAVLRYGRLGDVVLLSSLFQAITNEGLRCCFATRKEYENLYKFDPRVEKMFFLRNDSPMSLFSHAKEIKSYSPDFVIDAHLKLRTFALSALIGKKTASYDSKKRYRRSVVSSRDRSRFDFFTYRAYAESLQKLGFSIKSCPEPKLFVTERAIKKNIKITGKGTIAAIHCHSAVRSKRIDPETASSVSRKLSLSGVKTLLLGPANSFSVPVDIDMRGMTSDLEDLKAVLSISSVLITSDSGPMHVSEAVGTPVVAVFCSTSPLFGFKPWRNDSVTLVPDLECAPCSLHGRNKCEKNLFACTKYFSSDMIYIKAREIIENSFIPS
ncbi:glycosyltransferase family 9 protein [candidate division WOR-3 bacterium]|nr:glycosyltransferase family 9 protein [candidate division WOR-3 bacterium]